MSTIYAFRVLNMIDLSHHFDILSINLNLKPLGFLMISGGIKLINSLKFR